MIIGVKPKDGISGKANLKFFEVNNRGGATIMTQRAKGGDNTTVKTLGIKVIKYLVDGIIDGTINEEEIQKFKIKNQSVTENRFSVSWKKCQICEKGFRTEQGVKLHVNKMHVGDIRYTTCGKTYKTEREIKLHINRVHEQEKQIKCEICEKDFKTNHEFRIHMNRVHPGQDGIYCEVCRIILKGETEFRKHSELEHSEVVSPHAKKRKHDQEYYEKIIEEERLDISQVDNEMEVDNNPGKTLQEQEDEKVLLKQEKWFEEEVKFQEMKRKLSEDRRKEENKRKRQISIRKNKKSSEKKPRDTKEDLKIEEIVKDITSDGQINDGDGPGCMGWSVNDKEKEKHFDLNGAFEEIQSLFNGIKNPWICKTDKQFEKRYKRSQRRV